ncbi:MAG: DUF1801 domain-containing protein [Kofleriaceae bacterium]|nr:DUF1801 domain-containing protein [Kofleriaceae bacterium]
MNAVDQYLAKLPADRRDAIAKVRDVVNANLPDGYEETIQYGMISWIVPESVLPAADVYNKQPLALASLASQKSHMALYMLSVYGDPKERAWFESAYKKSGKKLDMGASCVRFKSLAALPLDVIGEAMSHVGVDQYVATYRKVRAATKSATAKEKAAVAPAKAAKRAKAAKPKSKAKPAARTSKRGAR